MPRGGFPRDGPRSHTPGFRAWPAPLPQGDLAPPRRQGDRQLPPEAAWLPCALRGVRSSSRPMASRAPLYLPPHGENQPATNGCGVVVHPTAGVGRSVPRRDILSRAVWLAPPIGHPLLCGTCFRGSFDPAFEGSAAPPLVAPYTGHHTQSCPAACPPLRPTLPWGGRGAGRLRP